MEKVSPEKDVEVYIYVAVSRVHYTLLSISPGSTKYQEILFSIGGEWLDKMCPRQDQVHFTI